MFLRVFVASSSCALLLGFAGLMFAGADAEGAAFIMVTTAGLPIVLASVGAGQLARVAARAQPAWNRRDWVGRGARFGAISGGALLLLWVVVFNLPAGFPPFALLGLMLVVGGVTGSVVGSLVGLYCARWTDNRLTV